MCERERERRRERERGGGMAYAWRRREGLRGIIKSHDAIATRPYQGIGGWECVVCAYVNV